MKIFLCSLFCIPSVALYVTPLRLRPAAQPVVRMQGQGPPRSNERPGFYQRPSAALEKGGAFFVPGLQGGRARLAAAGVICAGFALNRVTGPGGDPTQLVSEVLGVISCGVVFAQAFAQSRLEQQADNEALSAAITSRLKEEQTLDGSVSAETAERATWAAGALLRLTPAQAVVWLDADRPAPLLCMGRFPPTDAAAEVGPSLASLLPASSTSATVALLEGQAPPRPLPRNAAAVVLARPTAGSPRLIALASEQPAAFSADHERWAELLARLLESCGHYECP